ncbi:MAG: hypothetical protein ABWY11_01660 [Umezawaea sp.]
MRNRADELTAATTELDRTTKDRRAAEGALGTAQVLVEGLEGGLLRAQAQRQDFGTALRELLDSRAFQDAASAAGRVEGLQD